MTRTQLSFERELLHRARSRDFPDQDFSLVNRTSFAAMERLGIERVASLDEDFLVFRYGARKEKAFGVVR